MESGYLLTKALCHTKSFHRLTYVDADHPRPKTVLKVLGMCPHRGVDTSSIAKIGPVLNV